MATADRPALAAILLTGIVMLAVLNYSTLLGVPAGATAAWALPAQGPGTRNQDPRRNR
jgi:hypothetical protein